MHFDYIYILREGSHNKIEAEISVYRKMTVDKIWFTETSQVFFQNTSFSILLKHTQSFQRLYICMFEEYAKAGVLEKNLACSCEPNFINSYLSINRNCCIHKNKPLCMFDEYAKTGVLEKKLAC